MFTEADLNGLLAAPIGQAVTVQQPALDDITIQGKFRDESVIELEVATTAPQVIIKRSDFARFNRANATLVIAGTSYKIKHVQYESTGFVLLYLKKA